MKIAEFTDVQMKDCNDLGMQREMRLPMRISGFIRKAEE